MGVKKDSCVKNAVLSVEKYGAGVKFLHRHSFRTQLQQHLSSTYNLECLIGLTENQEFGIKMAGKRADVNSAHETVNLLLTTMQERIFDQDNTDQLGR